MWGDFPTITNPNERNYVRIYWRFLLGWAKPPTDAPINAPTLRRLARAEIKAYKDAARLNHGKVINPFDDNDPTPTPAAAKAA